MIFSTDCSSEDFGRYAKMALRLEPENAQKLIRNMVWRDDFLEIRIIKFLNLVKVMGTGCKIDSATYFQTIGSGVFLNTTEKLLRTKLTLNEKEETCIVYFIVKPRVIFGRDLSNKSILWSSLIQNRIMSWKKLESSFTRSRFPSHQEVYVFDAWKCEFQKFIANIFLRNCGRSQSHGASSFVSKCRRYY